MEKTQSDVGRSHAPAPKVGTQTPHESEGDYSRKPRISKILKECPYKSPYNRFSF